MRSTNADDVFVARVRGSAKPGATEVGGQDGRRVIKTIGLCLVPLLAVHALSLYNNLRVRADEPVPVAITHAGFAAAPDLTECEQVHCTVWTGPPADGIAYSVSALSLNDRSVQLWMRLCTEQETVDLTSDWSISDRGLTSSISGDPTEVSPDLWPAQGTYDIRGQSALPCYFVAVPTELPVAVAKEFAVGTGVIAAKFHLRSNPPTGASQVATIDVRHSSDLVDHDRSHLSTADIFLMEPPNFSSSRHLDRAMVGLSLLMVSLMGGAAILLSVLRLARGSDRQWAEIRGEHQHARDRVDLTNHELGRELIHIGYHIDDLADEGYVSAGLECRFGRLQRIHAVGSAAARAADTSSATFMGPVALADLDPSIDSVEFTGAGSVTSDAALLRLFVFEIARLGELTGGADRLAVQGLPGDDSTVVFHLNAREWDLATIADAWTTLASPVGAANILMARMVLDRLKAGFTIRTGAEGVIGTLSLPDERSGLDVDQGTSTEADFISTRESLSL